MLRCCRGDDSYSPEFRAGASTPSSRSMAMQRLTALARALLGLSSWAEAEATREEGIGKSASGIRMWLSRT